MWGSVAPERGKVWDGGIAPPPRVKYFLKNRGEMNVSRDDLNTKMSKLRVLILSSVYGSEQNGEY